MSTNRDPQARAQLTQRLEELKITTLRLPRSEVIIERELLTSKWPAYHFMSPHAATLHFAELYREAAGRKFGQEFGQNWTCPGKLESSSDGKRSISWASRSAGSARSSKLRPFVW